MPNKMQPFSVGAALLMMLAGCTAKVDLDCDGAETRSIAWGETALAVVTEGEGEPRSLGSYSLRVYDQTGAGGERDLFTTGLIFARDGFLKRVELADIDGDELDDLVVVFESAGTGSYLSAHAWRLLDNQLSSVATVEGLAPDAHVAGALIAQIKAMNALEPEQGTPQE